MERGEERAGWAVTTARRCTSRQWMVVGTKGKVLRARGRPARILSQFSAVAPCQGSAIRLRAVADPADRCHRLGRMTRPQALRGGGRGISELQDGCPTRIRPTVGAGRNSWGELRGKGPPSLNTEAVSRPVLLVSRRREVRNAHGSGIRQVGTRLPTVSPARFDPLAPSLGHACFLGRPVESRTMRLTAVETSWRDSLFPSIRPNTASNVASTIASTSCRTEVRLW